MKKGLLGLQLSWVFDLFFIALIIIIFLGINLKLQNDQTYALNLQARDYSYVKDVASISPEKIVFIYKKNIQSEILEKNCQIDITSEAKELIPARYYCSINNPLLKITQSKEQMVIKNE